METAVVEKIGEVRIDHRLVHMFNAVVWTCAEGITQ